MRQQIGLDTRMLSHTGIGTYLRGLLDGFQKIHLGQSLELSLYGRKPLGPWPHQVFQQPIYSIREQWHYPKKLAQCQLWHAPHYNIPLRKGRTKLVVTIHDIIHWIFRKQLRSPLKAAYAGFMLKKAVTLADHIIAVSHHTKKDLIQYFKADERKITVIHEGVSEYFHPLSPETLKAAFEKLHGAYGIPEKFFLYVGMLKPHKNAHTLIRVFQALKKAGKVKASLVLIGRKDKKYPPGYKELEQLVSTSDIIHLSSVKYDDLIYFYNLALALIHPSLYEGFGLTLLEAMRCGTPVMTTHAASIPEVVGDAAVCVDPFSEKDMANALITLENNATLRESLRQKGLVHSRSFQWSRTAEKTIMVYNKILFGI